jgi:hypothetical protein
VVKRDEIEQRFVDAGWDLDGSFEDHLLIGHDGYRISLLAHREHWDAEQPTFEILDHEEMTTHWVEEVPTPLEALQLVKEHGQPPEEGVGPALEGSS